MRLRFNSVQSQEEPWVRESERVSEKIARRFVSQLSVGCARFAPTGDQATAILVTGFLSSRCGVWSAQSSTSGAGSAVTAGRVVASTVEIWRFLAVKKVSQQDLGPKPERNSTRVLPVSVRTAVW